MSDDFLVIQRILGGDPEPFRILVEKYQDSLVGLVRNLLPKTADWEGLAQEVFLAAYRHLGSYDRRRGAFSTWLFTIARNQCRNLLKKKSPVVAAHLPELADCRTPAAAAEDEEWFRQLDAALAALPFDQQTVFVLAEFHGLSLAEIGSIERVKLGTVKSRLSRAREALRKLLAPRVEQT